MCGKIMTVLLIFVALNCSMARYNGRLHCIVGVLPICYKRKAATYFYPPGGTGLAFWDLIFLIFKFLFYTLDLYVWKNNDRIIDFCCFKLFDGTV